MNNEIDSTVEKQLKTLATELERTRRDLHELQRQHRRSALSTRIAGVIALLVMAFIGIAGSSPRAAQQSVSRFEAPFIVHDKSGKTIAEITDGSSGSYGLNVYNPRGGSGAVAFLGGTNNGNGKMQLGDAGGNSLVEAGVLPGNLGVVRVYPMNGKSPIPIPNFIKGAAPQ